MAVILPICRCVILVKDMLYQAVLLFFKLSDLRSELTALSLELLILIAFFTSFLMSLRLNFVNHKNLLAFTTATGELELAHFCSNLLGFFRIIFCFMLSFQLFIADICLILGSCFAKPYPGYGTSFTGIAPP